MTQPAPPRRRLGFYRRLSRAQKAEYDRSDDRRTLPLRPDAALGRTAGRIVAALEAGDRSAVGRTAQALVDALCVALVGGARKLEVMPPRIKVLRTRPRKVGSELHGLYSRFEDGRSEIRVWMLTAAHGQVVKPRTFLRTLLHEVCHHVDMTLLDLPHSFHTLGFHARESSLVRALERSGATIPGGRGGQAAVEAVGEAEDVRAPEPLPGPGRKKRAPEPPRQLDLFER
jgi:hypothetical protein